MILSNNIKKLLIKHPIIQGGMGIGISSYKLAGTVSKEGALGILSSAGLDMIVSARYNKKIGVRAAAAIEVLDAKKIAQDNPVGMNFMTAVANDYKDSVLGAMDAGVDVIVSGAGLPLHLPAIVNEHPRYKQVILIPIVSSGRTLDIICRRWEKTNRLPDAVIVEGPLAGGHIGWKSKRDAFDKKNSLENLVNEVLYISKKWGNIPVIAAGGIYSNKDVKFYLNMGCIGVQLGSRFAATTESGASTYYKQAIIDCKKEDIILADKPGSPCGMLFRVIKKSKCYQDALKKKRKAKCNLGYLLHNNKCPAKDSSEDYFCICNGLSASIGLKPDENELYTIGARGNRINSILSVKDLIAELIGKPV